MTAPTDAQLADLRARITKGPWKKEGDNCVYAGGQLVAIVTDTESNDFGQYLGDEDPGPFNAQAIALVPDLLDEVVRLREIATDTTAHLAAAISLLERGGSSAKKAAASDRMFNQMLDDYRSSLARARATLTTEKNDG